MVGLYTATLFISALLLFFVQPMVGKMILPKLGGTPAVWNTCMVFFQAMLLAGYAYAHGTAAWLGVRRQSVLHLLLLLVPLAVLPISVGVGATPPSTDLPIGWLLWQLFSGVGLPFFVVSSSAPLLQKWFAQTAHQDARDPYFLYAASNIGSLLALLGYPVLIEPHLRLGDQSRAWMWTYIAMIGSVAACAICMWRAATHPPVTAPANSTDNRDPSSESALASAFTVDVTLRDRLWWIALSAIPSSLMLGVTTFVTTDLAAVPLMWVLPLAIYLLTFVIVFARRPILRHAHMLRLLPFVLLPMGVLLFFRPRHLEWLTIPAHLLTFFIAAMVCHGELVRRRPAAARLTEFYLFMSVGGVLGGLFNAILAPQLFTGVVEYPLVMGLVCFVLPRPSHAEDSPAERRRDWMVPAGFAAATVLVLGLLRATSLDRTAGVLPIFFIVALLTCFTCKERPIRFGLSYAVLLVAVGFLADRRAGNLLHVERNFFGIKRVLLDPGGRLRLFVHGNTTHGCELLDPARKDEPSSYYHRRGPIGEVFAVLNAAPSGPNVGIIGLGVGAVAAYARPGQHFTFYEIDPGVERIARDTRYFNFLADCRGTCDVVLGDGRLTIARVPDHHFNLILLDAFSSDAVPTHLLAREAIELYLSKLTDDGIVAFHISNRFFNFEPLLANAAADLHLACLAKFAPQVTPEERVDGKLGSHCLVMTRHAERLRTFHDMIGWAPPASQPGLEIWTDQYCDIFGLFLQGHGLRLGPQAAIASPQ